MALCVSGCTAGLDEKCYDDYSATKKLTDVHPIVRDLTDCAVAVVTRTNNILEHYCATSEQGLRGRRGRAHLGRNSADQRKPVGGRSQPNSGPNYRPAHTTVARTAAL